MHDDTRGGFAKISGEIRRNLMRASVVLAAVLLPTATVSCSDASRSPSEVDAAEGSGEVKAAGEETPPAAPELVDAKRLACDARWKELEAAPGRAYGSGVLEKDRAAFVGRARGAVTLLVKEPGPSQKRDAQLDKELPYVRIARLVSRMKHDKKALRAILLRDGYVYADDPQDAFELDARIKLTDLFDEEHIVLERGEETFRLVRNKGKYETTYQHEDGVRKGKPAQVLFGDRLRLDGDAAPAPLHRDVLSFAHREGFDRMTVKRITDDALLADLRFGDTTLRTVVAAKGAKLSIECFAEPKEKRAAAAASLEQNRWRLRAEAAMREVVTQQLDEALPFDRPRDEKGPDKDGMLRPYWLTAYKNGRPGFEVDGQSYAVFLPDGRAQPPQVCVDFVLDTYERASGSWYAPRGASPGRPPGRLDINAHGIQNRRGVLGFHKFAGDNPALFDVRNFTGAERIPFENRKAFFAYLLENADLFRAGDVLAIQGLKRDDRIHQHAILLEFVDPLTGFPAGMADQMKLPRRRTWEGIMAEAPKRSLLYRARPTETIFRPLDDGSDRTQPVVATNLTP